MKFSLLCLVSLFVATTRVSAITDYDTLAHQAVDQVETGLTSCGLMILDAFDPRLPRPAVHADRTIVNRRGQVLAHYAYALGFGFNSYQFISPNGGNAHTITQGEEAIDFGLPMAGSVAAARRAFTAAGPFEQLYCRGVPVSNATVFYSCIERNFVQVILNQLCPWAR